MASSNSGEQDDNSNARINPEQVARQDGATQPAIRTPLQVYLAARHREVYGDTPHNELTGNANASIAEKKERSGRNLRKGYILVGQDGTEDYVPLPRTAGMAPQGANASAEDQEITVTSVRRYRRQTQNLKIAHCYALNTENYVIDNISYPSLTENQDELIGENIEAFSDSEDCYDAGEPKWTRLTYKLSINIPKFDFAVTDEGAPYDAVIAVAGCTICQPDVGVAAEISLFVKKTLQDRPHNLEAEFITNNVDVQEYQDKLSATYEPISNIWKSPRERAVVHQPVFNPYYRDQGRKSFSLLERRVQSIRRNRVLGAYPHSRQHPFQNVPSPDANSVVLNKFNDPEVYDARGSSLHTVTNAWRTDVYSMSKMSFGDCDRLRQKYIEECISTIKGHSRRTERNVVPYHMPRGVHRIQDWEDHLHNLKYLDIPSPSASFTSGMQSPSISVPQVVVNFTDKIMIAGEDISLSRNYERKDIRSSSFLPFTGLRSFPLYNTPDVFYHPKNELVEEMRLEGYRFTNNPYTGGPELLRGIYKPVSRSSVVGINHCLVMMPGDWNTRSLISRVQFLPPIHMASQTVPNVFNEMQSYMYLHDKYKKRPHIGITATFNKERILFDAVDQKLYSTHSMLGLVTVVFTSRRIKMDLLIDIRTDHLTPSVTHMKTTPLNPQDIGVLRVKM